MMTRLSYGLKVQIDWLVSRLHVGQSDDQVRADIESRIFDPELAKLAGDYAVKIHHENRDLYRRVMSGRL